MASRVSKSSFLLSSMPRGNFSRSRITAAATTGPASGAQPASSTPASGVGKSRSSLKQGRAIAVANPFFFRHSSESCNQPYFSVDRKVDPGSSPGWRILTGHPPRREAAGFAGLVEEDGVAGRVAQPRLAPHPGLVARAMLEGNAQARQLVDQSV